MPCVNELSAERRAAGEPELAVSPAAVQAPVHVYQPAGRQGPQLLSKYGADRSEKPVRVLFYGAHYDALIESSRDAADTARPQEASKL